jgi:hypothetical protein
MKKLYKAALLVSLGLAGITAVQAATYNGDLLVGFSQQSVGNDLIYDLGSYSSLTDGETWDLTSLLAGYDVTTVNWGVIGSKSSPTPRTAWTTVLGNPINGNSAWAALNTPAASIYGNFAAAGAGQSLSITNNDDDSWTVQTISPDLPTDYLNAYGNPNVQGLTSDTLYQLTVGGGAPTAVGAFTLTGGEDILTFNVEAAPEPSTYGLLFLGGLLAVSLRRKFHGKQA